MSKAQQLIALCEDLRDGRRLPSIFERTTYRLPTTDELDEFFGLNLSPQDVVDGFSYTIVGRGILWAASKRDIVESIRLLCERFPENLIYPKALEMAKEIIPRRYYEQS